MTYKCWCNGKTHYILDFKPEDNINKKDNHKTQKKKKNSNEP